MSSEAYNLCAAIQAGMRAAWLARSNPYAAGTELHAAFNRGRRMAAECAPGLGADWLWYNSYTFEGQLKCESINFVSDSLGWQHF